MKFSHDTDDPLDQCGFGDYGSEHDYAEDDGEQPPFPTVVDPDEFYLLTSFPTFGVGFTAPKGHIKLTMNVHGSRLEEVAQIVRHAGEQMQVLVYAAKKPFDGC